MNPIEQLKSVLCDPSGKCCIAGSDEDRAIVDNALSALAQPEHGLVTTEASLRFRLDSEKQKAADLLDDVRELKGIIKKLMAAQPKPQPEQDGLDADCIAGVVAQPKPLTDELYNELIFAVGNKYPNETRHQTALRYIQQAETCGAQLAKAHIGAKQ